MTVSGRNPATSPGVLSAQGHDPIHETLRDQVQDGAGA